MGKGCNEDLSNGLLLLLDSLRSGSVENHIIQGEAPIEVVRTTSGSKTIDTIRYNPDIAFTGSLSLDFIDTNPTGASYKSGTVPLKGVQVIQADFSWSWAREGTSIDVEQEFDALTLASTDKSISRTGLTVEHTDGVSDDPAVEDRRFILTGTDGEQTTTLKKDIAFGNRIYYVEALEDLDQAGVISALLGANGYSAIRTSATGFTILPKSLVTDIKLYVAVPADLGGSVVFIDDSSPISTDPMKVLYTGVQMTNGYIADESYNIYVSLQGSLRGTSIRVVST